MSEADIDEHLEGHPHAEEAEEQRDVEVDEQLRGGVAAAEGVLCLVEGLGGGV